MWNLKRSMGLRIKTWKSSSGSHKLPVKEKAIFPLSSSAGGISGSGCHDFFTTLWLSNAAQEKPYETFTRKQCAAAAPWPAQHFGRIYTQPQARAVAASLSPAAGASGLPDGTQLLLSAEILSNCNHIMSMQHHSQGLSAKE